MKNYILYRDGKIWYYDYGTGDVIVLLHGYLESSGIWSSFAEKLSGKYRVIAVDLPGHGLSDVYSECHSMEFMAGVVSKLLESLKIKRIFLAGHSLGGYVALAFLELFPVYLSGYCLFHSHPFADAMEAVEKREREIKIVRAGKKDIMYPDNVAMMFAPGNIDRFSNAFSRVKTMASEIPAGGIIAVLNGMMSRPSRLSVMEEGRVPLLWILGRMDNYIPCEMVKERVRLPLNAKIAVLENSGHLGFVEEEERSIEIMKDFIEGLPL